MVAVVKNKYEKGARNGVTGQKLYDGQHVLTTLSVKPVVWYCTSSPGPLPYRVQRADTVKFRYPLPVRYTAHFSVKMVHDGTQPL